VARRGPGTVAVGKLVEAWLIERWGRRPLIIAFGSLSAAAVLYEAGVCKAMLPREVGDLEAEPVDGLQMIEPRPDAGCIDPARSVHSVYFG
jgi:hypothetical protein